MAWNEPGGGDNKNPWGSGGNNNQGPPDLDEALRKFQEKLSGIFGGKSGGNGGQSQQIGGGLIVAAVVVLAIVWGLFGIYQVDEKDRAVVLRFGKYLNTNTPGLQWNPPLIDKVLTVRVTEERQYSSRGMMLTEDENIVELPLTVQYNISDPKAFLLNVKTPELSLQQASDSALRHVVGGTTLDDVVSSGRAEVGTRVKVRLQRYLDMYGTGINVVKINIQEAKPPSEVKEAYDDVIKAREDQERFINESQAYANGIIPEARGAAQRTLEEATAYRAKVIVEAQGEAARFEKLLTEYKKAPRVTRERLYISAVEEVMSNTSKVMVDVAGGNNMMYLPLDKLVQQRSNVKADDGHNPQDIDSIAEQVIKKLQRQQDASRRQQRGSR
ncbi:FtsH protease activity modulator HflK [Dasania marina]|uniref:FtsH protease activity modulator HflK n=1 Tax=Dasania marina TaxID=471499 RepID=UPI00036856BB|nr:FtsH protease activity modulator HflK [Dasania marina]|tara:strand:- start:79060 stop:80214 length:1155 start_codon:yes stop_codon:yes gene_type:complete